MMAKAEWERWEGIPSGIKQSVIDKITSRSPVNAAKLPEGNTTHKITMEVKCSFITRSSM